MTARARKPGESFKEYRKNLKAEGRWLDQRCSSGWLLWDSSARGTYVRAQHGELRR